jgi:para-nitrobenzyl esterase
MTGNSEGGKRLALQLGAAIAAFARTGNPNHSRIPTWSPYNESQRPVMVFHSETRQLNDPNRELRQMWDRILAK